MKNKKILILAITILLIILGTIGFIVKRLKKKTENMK